MDDNTSNLLRTALEAYLARLDGEGLEPSDSYLPYNFEKVDAVKWRPLGNVMVKDELRELINCLNQWHRSLQRWQAWNSVITSYGLEEAWDLREEFLDALVHRCLFQPSAMRDTFTLVVTNSMHQVHLGISKDRRDFLEGDPTTPDEHRQYLSRRQKEKRMSDLISPWPGATRFMTSLRQLDDPNYRQQTSDYRNLTSHSIGPRLGIGITRVVTRTVVQATEMVKQTDGTFIPTPVPGKVAVSYGFGGTEPLDLDQALAANLEQFRRARVCYSDYQGLLAAGLSSMPPVAPAP